MHEIKWYKSCKILFSLKILTLLLPNSLTQLLRHNCLYLFIDRLAKIQECNNIRITVFVLKLIWLTYVSELDIDFLLLLSLIDFRKE